VEAVSTSKTSVNRTIVNSSLHISSYWLENVQRKVFTSGKINYGLVPIYAPISEIYVVTFTMSGHILGKNYHSEIKLKVSSKP
jgi:hypothetical protein